MIRRRDAPDWEPMRLTGRPGSGWPGLSLLATVVACLFRHRVIPQNTLPGSTAADGDTRTMARRPARDAPIPLLRGRREGSGARGAALGCRASMPTLQV